MAYSEFELRTTDLDIYFEDSNKYIHIASAGGSLPNQLVNLDDENELFKESLNYDESNNFEILINPNLIELLQLDNEGLELYTEDFARNARMGFYSYDKTNLGDFDDNQFHLVARPVSNNTSDLIFENVPQITNVNLPIDFVVFSLLKVFITNE